MATLNSFDFSSCLFVGFAPANSPTQWVCSGFWYLGVLHEVYVCSVSILGQFLSTGILVGKEPNCDGLLSRGMVPYHGKNSSPDSSQSCNLLQTELGVPGPISNVILEGTKRVLKRNHKATVFAFSRSYSKENHLFSYLLLFSRQQ